MHTPVSPPSPFRTTGPAGPDIEIVPSPARSARSPGANEPSSRPRLASAFEPLLLLCLRLRSGEDVGAAGPLRRRLHRMLASARYEAREAGEEAVHDAAYAVVALIDETVQQHGGDETSDWLARPMQLDLFGRFDAGEEFFVVLDRLRKAPDEHADVLEVYYLCLALGFRGRYRLEGEAARQQLLDGLYDDLNEADLPSRTGEASDGQRGTAAATAASGWRVFAAGAAAAVLLAALLYGGMSVRISGAAADARSAIEAAAPASSAPLSPASSAEASSVPSRP